MMKKNNSENELFNYIRLTNPITDIFTRRYAYLDSKDYMADHIFVRMGIKVKFYKEEFRKGPWVIVRCIVKRKDKQVFLQAMRELSNDIILCRDGTGYIEVCKHFRSAFQKVLSGEYKKNPS